jgi:hypothetical protein
MLEAGMPNFLITYGAADAEWADWIASTLEGAGYTVTLQKWDFQARKNFALQIRPAAASAYRTIAVLSSDYMIAPEWAAAFKEWAEGTNRTLVSVRVRECKTPIAQGVTIDLVGLDEEGARRALLHGLKDMCRKPVGRSDFAGAESEAKTFPGGSDTNRRTSVRPARRMPRMFGAATYLDRRNFIKETFEVIREQFRESLAEFAQRNAGLEVDLTRVDATKFTAEVFVNGEIRARCKIWQGSMFNTDGICYAEGRATLSDNTCNELLMLAGDESELAFHATMNASVGRASEGLNPERLSPDEAAEYLWRRFIRNLD